MHAALSSHRGCLQVLFLGILSGHVHSVTLRLQYRVGGRRQNLIRRFEHKEKVVAPREIRWKNDQVENISYIRCVHTP